MATTVNNSDQYMKRCIDQLLIDLNQLSSESKKKYSNIKDACELCALKLRQINSLKTNIFKTLCESSLEIIQPFILACDTKQSKIIQISLNSVQKIIEAKVLNQNSATVIVDTLWQLTDLNLEELKILQTIILLVNSNDMIIKHYLLAKTITIGLRLCTSKDQTIMNTASAMVSQMINTIFERCMNINEFKRNNLDKIDFDRLKLIVKEAPSTLDSSTQDAFMILQDLCMLLNADTTVWLYGGISDINRIFALDLLKTILTKYYNLFFINPEMSFLLKERICPLLIKLFSPSSTSTTPTSSINQNLNSFTSSSSSSSSNNQNEKQFYLIQLRLIRIVYILIKYYFQLIITECEIFLSLILKYIDLDTSLSTSTSATTTTTVRVWQRILACEFIYKLISDKSLIKLIYLNYDMKQYTENILQTIITSINTFIYYLFQLISSSASTSSNGGQSQNGSNQNSLSNISGGSSMGGSSSQSSATNHDLIQNSSSYQHVFTYKDVSIYLISSNQFKPLYFLDNWDKMEIPQMQSCDIYLLTLNYYIIHEYVQTIYSIILDICANSLSTSTTTAQQGESTDASVNEQKKVYYGLLFDKTFKKTFNYLLDACYDDLYLEHILKTLNKYIQILTLLNVDPPQPQSTSQINQIANSPNKTAPPSSVYIDYLVIICKYTQQLGYYLFNNTNHDHHYDVSMTTSANAIQTNSSSNNTIVAMGPPLNGSYTTQQIHLTNKNLQIFKYLLDPILIQFIKQLDYTSWYVVLNTIEHVLWTLNIKPSIQFQQQQQQQHNYAQLKPQTDTTIIITQSIQPDLQQICLKLTQIFEKTKDLDDVHLHYIINSLVKLTNDTFLIQNLTKTNEPCLFSICKLYELFQFNLFRLKTIYTPITQHLFDLCKHPNLRLREYSIEILSLCIKCAFQSIYGNSTSLDSRQSLIDSATTATATTVSGVSRQEQEEDDDDDNEHEIILKPLDQLSSIQFNDIRHKQLECTLNILRLYGQYIKSIKSWPILLSIIGSINKEQNEILIRSAFQCLQLVVQDFLFKFNLHNLDLLINTISKFCIQEQDLNISLTAIVLLWNISDHMYQNYLMNNIQSTWMILYSCLGKLCVDQRPSVRKSACQTLFCTISSHSTQLKEANLNDLIETILFKLLDIVKYNTQTASKQRDGNYLMHHTRDTAEKQWAETSVLTLNCIIKVFNSKLSQLIKLNNFHKQWSYLLDYIEYSALYHNNIEISLASLKSFHELLGNHIYYSSAASSNNSNNSAAAVAASIASSSTAAATSPSSIKHDDLQQQQQQSLSNTMKYLDISHWLAAWKLWINIGVNLKQMIQIDGGSKAGFLGKKLNANGFYEIPINQTYLTCYMDLMAIILNKIGIKFSEKDFEQYSNIIDKVLLIPVLNGDFAASFLFQHDPNATSTSSPSTSIQQQLTPLQNSCLNSIKCFIQISKSNEQFEDKFMPYVFQRLLSFSLYSCTSCVANGSGSGCGASINGGNSATATTSAPSGFFGNSSISGEYMNINFVPFGEKCLNLMTNLYEEYANHKSIIDQQIFKLIIQTLYTPLSMKYSCPNASTWKLSIDSLFRVLRRGLNIQLRNKNNAADSMWDELAKTFEDFLFTKNVGTSELTIETMQKDEQIDCQVIELIRDEILSNTNQIPSAFIQKILKLLNRGSIYSNVSESFMDFDSMRKLREEFSKTCFETLLKFSFISSSASSSLSNSGTENSNNSGSVSNDNSLNRMALTSMLQRCKDIIQHYAHDERLNANVPLPKARTNEMQCVLRALCTLINSLKKAPKDSVQIQIWNQVIGLYPCLVECTTSPSTQICCSVKDALHHYFSLLSPPSITTISPNYSN